MFFPLTPLPHISLHLHLRQSCHSVSCLLSADKCHSVASPLSPSHMSMPDGLHSFSFCLFSHPCPFLALSSISAHPSNHLLSPAHRPHLPTFCSRLFHLITSRVVQCYASLAPLPAAHKECESCTERNRRHRHTQSLHRHRCFKCVHVHACIAKNHMHIVIKFPTHTSTQTHTHTHTLLENIRFSHFYHESSTW